MRVIHRNFVTDSVVKGNRQQPQNFVSFSSLFCVWADNFDDLHWKHDNNNCHFTICSQLSQSLHNTPHFPLKDFFLIIGTGN